MPCPTCLVKVKSRILEILPSEVVCAIRLYVSKECPGCEGDISRACPRCINHVREQAMDDVREGDPDMANELLALAATDCETCDGRGTVPQSFANGEPCSGIVISCDPEVSGVNIGDDILFNPSHDSRVRLGYPQQKFFDLAALFGTTSDVVIPMGQTNDGYEWSLPIGDFDIIYFVDRMDILARLSDPVTPWEPPEPAAKPVASKLRARCGTIVAFPEQPRVKVSAGGILMTQTKTSNRLFSVVSSAEEDIEDGQQVVSVYGRWQEFFSSESLATLDRESILVKGEVAP